jgi:hypothetical protein
MLLQLCIEIDDERERVRDIDIAIDNAHKKEAL